ncbi:MAG: endolytic transglycosylase MltG [Lentimicrobiaceae bacterium]|nr:endolytic transglycosylase MltG [Lentimicrobiaceae bacterium]
MGNYYQKLYKKKAKRRKRNRVLSFLTIMLLILCAFTFYTGYKYLLKPNVWTQDDKPYALKIYETDTWDDVKNKLYENGTIINRSSFEMVAELFKYPTSVKKGNYFINSNMSNKSIISKLRSGNQDPINVIFNNIRTAEEFAHSISSQLEIDSISIINKLNDEDFLKQNGYNKYTALCMFIPNTYEVYWTISTDAFFERMLKENNIFWNENRTAKLEEIRFTKEEAYTLASIVEKETNQNSEKADIAGVYINRLKQGWLLQADPTLVYALGDFSIKRVLNVYKTIDSPYNTYRYWGLPPGPICIPSISSIDAVLNYNKHNYMFFCAREDFSGYHNFASSIEEHNKNAYKYRTALDKINLNQ